MSLTSVKLLYLMENELAILNKPVITRVAEMGLLMQYNYHDSFKLTIEFYSKNVSSTILE